MDIPIESIEVMSNPRLDFDPEGLQELALSIGLKGVLQPVVVAEIEKDNKYQLVIGHRRLKAAKIAGLKKIPAVVKQASLKEGRLELQLVENLQREDLNPVEEGLAFKEFFKVTKKNAKYLAKKISKSEIYVKRRVELLKASENVQQAMRDGKIRLGHALALSQVSEKKKQDKILKEIIRDRLTVFSTCNSIRQGSRRLENAPFDIGRCQGCKFNGGEQTLLDESEGTLSNVCLSPNCFDRNVAEWMQTTKKNIKASGVKIVDGEAANRLYRKKIHKHDKGAVAAAEKDMEKHPEDYAVQLEKDWQGNFEKVIFRLKPEKKTRGTEPTDPKVAVAQLKNKIEEFKRWFLIRKNKEKQVPDSKISKALTAFFMIEEAGWSRSKNILKDIEFKSDGYGIDSEKLLRKVLGLDERFLDEVINKQNQIRIRNLGLYDNTLLILSKATKIDMKKEFQVNESYLNLYTIAQLPKIAKELGVKVSPGKKTEMIKEILDQDLKGKVPKAMMLK